VALSNAVFTLALTSVPLATSNPSNSVMLVSVPKNMSVCDLPKSEKLFSKSS
jgi:hypothetical protein